MRHLQLRPRAAAIVALLLLPACSGSSPSAPTDGPRPLSFSASVPVGGHCCLLYRPQIAVEGDLVYVAWTEAIRFTTYLPMRRSTDGGASFREDLDFVDATYGDRDRVDLAAAPGLGLQVAWQDSRNGTCDPFCRGYDINATLSADAGSSFAPILYGPPNGRWRRARRPSRSVPGETSWSPGSTSPSRRAPCMPRAA